MLGGYDAIYVGDIQLAKSKILKLCVTFLHSLFIAVKLINIYGCIYLSPELVFCSIKEDIG